MPPAGRHFAAKSRPVCMWHGKLGRVRLTTSRLVRLTPKILPGRQDLLATLGIQGMAYAAVVGLCNRGGPVGEVTALRFQR